GGAARDQIANRNQIRRSITVSLDGERVAVQFADSPRVEAPLGGSSTPATLNGEAMRVFCVLQGDTLVQRFQAAYGRRRNESLASLDGQTFILRGAVETPRPTPPLHHSPQSG